MSTADTDERAADALEPERAFATRALRQQLIAAGVLVPGVIEPWHSGEPMLRLDAVAHAAAAGRIAVGNQGAKLAPVTLAPKKPRRRQGGRRR